MTCPVKFDTDNKIWWAPSKENLFSHNQTLGQLLLDRLNEIPSDNVLEVNYDNGNEWTASDIRRLSITCANNYLRLGVQSGDIVLFFSSLNSYTTPTVFGCYLIGAVVHPLDVNCCEDDLEFSVNIVDPKIILCDGDVYDKVILVVQKAKLNHLKHVLSFQSRDDKNTVPDMILRPVGSTEHFQSPKMENPEVTTALLLSSSGSLGRPKISMISHSVMIHAVQMWWKLNEYCVVYCASLFRCVSQIATMIQSALYGFRRIVTSMPPAGEVCARIIQKHKVTHTFGLPTLLMDIVGYAEKHDINIDFVRLFCTGGEVIPYSLCGQVKRVIPKCRVVKVYEMTELAGPISSNELIKDYDGNGGYLVPGACVKIVDKNFHLLGYNERGLICFKTEFIFSGYWRGDRTTEEAFDADNWFISGDFGYMDDKNLLHVVDRHKDIVVSGSKMIFPSITEQILCQHPYVSAAVIVGVPDLNKGQIAAAFLKLKDNVKAIKQDHKLRREILEYLTTQIPNDQIPSGGIYFVNTFPLTYTGKVNRPEFKKIAVQLIQDSRQSMIGV